MQYTQWIFLTAHILASAAWFGAMLYSLIILHPRARLFFDNPSQFEEFIAWIAAGSRWKVLGGCVIIALTGIGLLFLSGIGNKSTIWFLCIITKILLFLFAVSLFCFVSWKLWPARILAPKDKALDFQRKFHKIAIMLLVLVGVSITLSVLCSHLKCKRQPLAREMPAMTNDNTKTASWSSRPCKNVATMSSRDANYNRGDKVP